MGSRRGGRARRRGDSVGRVALQLARLGDPQPRATDAKLPASAPGRKEQHTIPRRGDPPGPATKKVLSPGTAPTVWSAARIQADRTVS